MPPNPLSHFSLFFFFLPFLWNWNGAPAMHLLCRHSDVRPLTHCLLRSSCIFFLISPFPMRGKHTKTQYKHIQADGPGGKGAAPPVKSGVWNVLPNQSSRSTATAFVGHENEGGGSGKGRGGGGGAGRAGRAAQKRQSSSAAPARPVAMFSSDEEVDTDGEGMHTGGNRKKISHARVVPRTPPRGKQGGNSSSNNSSSSSSRRWNGYLSPTAKPLQVIDPIIGWLTKHGSSTSLFRPFQSRPPPSPLSFSFPFLFPFSLVRSNGHAAERELILFRKLPRLGVGSTNPSVAHIQRLNVTALFMN